MTSEILRTSLCSLTTIVCQRKIHRHMLGEHRERHSKSNQCLNNGIWGGGYVASDKEVRSTAAEAPWATQRPMANTSFPSQLKLAAICHFQLPLAAFILAKKCPFSTVVRNDHILTLLMFCE